MLEAMGDAVFGPASPGALGERPGIYDLRDTFRGEEDRYFLDTVHVTGPGNERIAHRIAERLATEVRGVKAADAPPEARARDPERAGRGPAAGELPRDPR